MRLWLLLALALGFVVLVPRTKAADDDILEIKELPTGTDPEDVKFLEKKQESRKKLLEERKAAEKQVAKTISDLATQRETLAKTQNVTVTVDENTIEEKEPRTMEDVLNTLENKPNRRVRDEYEVSPDDFRIDVHDRWSINTTDFRFDAPQYVTGDIRQGAAKRWFVFTFSVTNSTPKKRRISPLLVAVTDKGVFNHSVGGFIPERLAADSVLRPLADSEELRDKELINQRVAPVESMVRLANYAVDGEKGAAQLSPMATFEPGQTRWGVAVWSDFSDEFTELKIIINGLNNAHRYEEKMRRALVLTFERKDDEFNVHRSQLKYKGKQWDYLWMWDQCVSVPLPGDAKDPQIKVQQLKTPAGADKLAWAFPFTITNSTRNNQDLAINTVGFVCNVQVDVGGAKIPVEACVVDDGRSTIYKSQVLKALGKEAIKDRFQFAPVEEGSKTLLQRRKIALEPGKNIEETYAIFDEADVDWDSVKLQVESELTRALDKKAAAGSEWEKVAKQFGPNDKDLLQKNPGVLYDPRRRLNDEEFAQVKEQVIKAIPAAVEAAKTKKTVQAYFDCTSGMSTGSYRVSRSYRKPGVVEEGWLTEWETWMKGWEAGEGQ